MRVKENKGYGCKGYLIYSQVYVYEQSKGTIKGDDSFPADC